MKRIVLNSDDDYEPIKPIFRLPKAAMKDAGADEKVREEVSHTTPLMKTMTAQTLKQLLKEHWILVERDELCRREKKVLDDMRKKLRQDKHQLQKWKQMDQKIKQSQESLSI